MKKVVSIIVTIIVIVAICVGVYFLTSGENNEINISVGNSKNTAEMNESTIKLIYDGKDMTPGAVFSRDIFGQEQSYSEVPSCAGQGTDKVYNYGSYEITAYQDGDEEKIFSVYFIDDKITTTEGVKVSDESSVMFEKYGDNYEQIGNQYTYISGNVEISFIIENNFIISITYTLVVQ